MGPRQRSVCSLGDLSPPREEWLRLMRKVEMLCSVRPTPKLLPSFVRYESAARTPRYGPLIARS
jgi:hypothetical protein